MGEEAAKLFFEGLEKGDAYSTKPRKMVLEPELICRESSLKHYK
jgi:hypothetical protein